MKILHVIFDSNYTRTFYAFIQKNFRSCEHDFLIYGSISNDSVFMGKEFHKITSFRKDSKKLRIIFSRADKIIFHGMFSESLNIFLFTHRNILKKAVWMIWGADIYPKNYSDKLKYFIFEKVIRTSVVRSFHTISALVPQDYEKLKEIYNTKTPYIQAFYPNPVDFEMLSDYKVQSYKNQTLTVLCGNSADPANNHFQMFDMLGRFRNENIKIICPLSYGGSKDYIQKTIEYGRTVFDDKIEFLLNFMPAKEYSNILEKTDIAVMNHNIQEGLGNIIALLYLGKKVFIRPRTTSFKFFNYIGVKLFSTDEIPSISFEAFSDILPDSQNSSLIYSFFNETNCIQLWKNLFLK